MPFAMPVASGATRLMNWWSSLPRGIELVTVVQRESVLPVW